MVGWNLMSVFHNHNTVDVSREVNVGKTKPRLKNRCMKLVMTQEPEPLTRLIRVERD